MEASGSAWPKVWPGPGLQSSSRVETRPRHNRLCRSFDHSGRRPNLSIWMCWTKRHAARQSRMPSSDLAVSTSSSTMQGTTVRKQPEDLTAQDWHLVMNTNLTGAFLCSQAAYPHMVRAGGGKIINIGSMMSVFASSYAAPYAASKAGIVQLAKSMAVAWAKDNIQVNAILPGWIDTELTQGARKQVQGLHEKVLGPYAGAALGSSRRFCGDCRIPGVACFGLRHRRGDRRRRRIFSSSLICGPQSPKRRPCRGSPRLPAAGRRLHAPPLRRHHARPRPSCASA